MAPKVAVKVPKALKVSQKTIDDIKRLGMTQALKIAGGNAKATKRGAVAEFEEGVRRMYGDRRLANAKSKAFPTVKPVKAKSADSARGFK